MYDAKLGRFASRDPLGFVDGMSLCRGYFVPGGVDPYGTNSIMLPPPNLSGPSRVRYCQLLCSELWNRGTMMLYRL